MKLLKLTDVGCPHWLGDEPEVYKKLGEFNSLSYIKSYNRPTDKKICNIMATAIKKVQEVVLPEYHVTYKLVKSKFSWIFGSKYTAETKKVAEHNATQIIFIDDTCIYVDESVNKIRQLINGNELINE